MCPAADPTLRYRVSSDPSELDLDVVHGYLARSYWSPEIPRDVVARAIAGSLCFGAYLEEGGAQVGFARLVTDRATFAYLADVFVLEEHRARGVSKLLMDAVVAHPDVQGLRRWSLATRDAHGLYERYGFKALAAPDRHMERLDPDVYRRRVGG
jgi:GNAT superfamily N-acetyltransferase